MASFRERLQVAAGPREQLRSSRVISTARALLAAASLVAIYLDPTEPTRFSAVAYGLLVFYVVYSLGVFLWIRFQSKVSARMQVLLHGFYLLWATTIMVFTEGPNSPFYLFFLFVLVAAAYRWGRRETILTAGTVVAILMVLALLFELRPPVLSFLPEGEFQANRFIMRSTYLLLMGVLLGYLAEEEKLLQAETAMVARLMGKIRVERGLRANLQMILEELLLLSGARRALLAVEESATGRLFLWDAHLGSENAAHSMLLSELEAKERDVYLFPAPVAGWYCERRSNAPVSKPAVKLIANPDGPPMNPANWALPESLPRDFPSHVALSLALGESWNGRLFLLDPAAGPWSERELAFLHKLGQEISPSLYNVYLLRRLRTRAGAAERARVARELHDGAIQSLLAVEMKVDVLRRKAAAELPETAADLERIQSLIHSETVNLRELMQQMRPVDLGPRQLLEFLADTTARFSRETGITARLLSDLDEVTVSPRIAREFARILQEALVNVRKHSGARNVVVRFASSAGHWHMLIDDDGKGFDFNGRKTLAELDALRKGPLVIKERVRAIGGQLTIESVPGSGARLEVVLPHRAYG